MTSLRQLRYFVKVVETGNITRAARALHVSQPSLGMQIRLLEEELGVILLERHSRGISVTLAGDVLAERARSVLHQMETLVTDVRTAGGRRRRVALGVPPSVIRLIGHDLLRYAQQNLPDIALSLVEERSVTLIKAMERDEIDYAFAYETDDRSDRWRIPLLLEELVFVTAPAEAPEGGVIPLRDAVQSNLAIADSRGLIRQLVEREAAKLGLHLTPAFEIHSISALQTILQEGRAAGIMPFGLAAEYARRKVLTCSRIAPPVTRTLYLEGPNWRPLPLEDAEFRALKDWATQTLVARQHPFARAVGTSTVHEPAMPRL